MDGQDVRVRYVYIEDLVLSVAFWDACKIWQTNFFESLSPIKMERANSFKNCKIMRFIAITTKVKDD